MDFIDKIKSGLKKNFSLTPQIKVCMMGPRQVGKTSILTAIFKNAGDFLTGSSIVLTPDGLTTNCLNEKDSELRRIFHVKSFDEKPNIGIDATSDVTDFKFNLRISNANINLIIKDYPGEFLKDRQEQVNEFVSEANAVFIAIDTPHLIEENGIYNEKKNSVSLVTTYFKDNFSSQKMGNKLIILIPLKCEKYFNENRMDEVRNKVEESYKELITFFQEQKGKIACVLAPIKTVGGIVFSDFLKDANGTTKVLNQTGVPSQANYRFASPKPAYTPEYCEQPLFYLFSFIAKQYTANKLESGFFNSFKNLFSLFSSDSSVLLAISQFGRKKIKDKNGYKIIVGNHLI
jgi:GTPase SAR1 family protein